LVFGLGKKQDLTLGALLQVQNNPLLIAHSMTQTRNIDFLI